MIMNVRIKPLYTKLLFAISIIRRDPSACRMPPPKQGENKSIPLSSPPNWTELILLPVSLNPVVSNPALEMSRYSSYTISRSDHVEIWGGVSLFLFLAISTILFFYVSSFLPSFTCRMSFMSCRLLFTFLCSLWPICPCVVLCPSHGVKFPQGASRGLAGHDASKYHQWSHRRLALLQVLLLLLNESASIHVE